MIAALVAWSARHSRFVLLATLVAGVAGDLARRGLARDVIPDLADPQIGIVADWMGHPAPAVAEAVTKQLTEALADVPGVKATRGTTHVRHGVRRRRVRLGGRAGCGSAGDRSRVDALRPKLPPGVRLYVGPAASSTGWVFEYALSDPALVSSQLDMLRFQEDVLKPALSAIPGVAEVATVGGEVQEVRVDVKARAAARPGARVLRRDGRAAPGRERQGWRDLQSDARRHRQRHGQGRRRRTDAPR